MSYLKTALICITMANGLSAEKGTIKYYEQQKGMGCISRTKANDVLFQYTFNAKSIYPSFKVGQLVGFDVVEGAKGPQATNVKPAK